MKAFWFVLNMAIALAISYMTKTSVIVTLPIAYIAYRAIYYYTTPWGGGISWILEDGSLVTKKMLVKTSNGDYKIGRQMRIVGLIIRGVKYVESPRLHRTRRTGQNEEVVLQDEKDGSDLKIIFRPISGEDYEHVSIYVRSSLESLPCGSYISAWTPFYAARYSLYFD